MKKATNNSAFRLICIAIAFGCAITAFLTYRQSMLLAIILCLVASLALMTLAGSLLAKRYLEGCIVRFLIRAGGSAPCAQVNSRFNYFYSALPELQARSLVTLENDVVILSKEKTKVGFHNKIMMWATRNQI